MKGGKAKAHLQFCDIPVFDLCVGRVICPRNVYAFHYSGPRSSAIEIS